MTREIACESVTRSIGTNFGFVGRLSPGEAFHCVLRRIDGRAGLEVISTQDRLGWTLVAVTNPAGEMARFRGRNWLFDPLASMEILLPRRPGVRLDANPLLLMLSVGGMRVRVPAPFDRSLRFRKRWSGLGARWAACENEPLDEILMALVAFRFWLQIARSHG